MNTVVNIDTCFGLFEDTFSPKIVGELNGQHVKLARLEGDRVPWHVHEDEDELFWVIEGALTIFSGELEARLGPGEFFIVPRGTRHRVVPHGHVRLVLFEPAETAHTGAVKAEITRERYERLELPD